MDEKINFEPVVLLHFVQLIGSFNGLMQVVFPDANLEACVFLKEVKDEIQLAENWVGKSAKEVKSGLDESLTLHELIFYPELLDVKLGFEGLVDAWVVVVKHVFQALIVLEVKFREVWELVQFLSSVCAGLPELAHALLPKVVAFLEVPSVNWVIKLVIL